MAVGGAGSAERLEMGTRAGGQAPAKSDNALASPGCSWTNMSYHVRTASICIIGHLPPRQGVVNFIGVLKYGVRLQGEEGIHLIPAALDFGI